MSSDINRPREIVIILRMPEHASSTVKELVTHQMVYRRFGRTGLRMPLLTLGSMRFQNSWKDQPPEQIPKEGQENLRAIFEHALELGINHIETARGYGTSEMQLGWLLSSVPREKLIVQTKVGPSADPNVFIEKFEKSMQHLGVDYVDLLAIHGINDEEGLEWSIRKGGCLEQARRFQREGRVRFIGFSTHAPTDVILRGLRHDDGQGGFDYVNLHWYYIFQANWSAVEEAGRTDRGVLIISPNDKGGKLYQPSEKLVDLCKPLHPMVFNDLFCMSRSQVGTLSIGAARPGDLDIHAEAVTRLGEASQLLPPIERRLAEAMRTAVGIEHPEQMSAGLPQPNLAPDSVNIPKILWLRNLVLGWDMLEFGKMRYNLLGSGGTWFPGANASKLDEIDPQLLARAVAASPYAERIPAMLREAHALLGGDVVKRLQSE